MLCNCPPCQQLISTGKRHSGLETISHISNSELVKCTFCYSFYLYEHGYWEPLSANGDQFSPPTATRYDLLLQN